MTYGERTARIAALATLLAAVTALTLAGCDNSADYFGTDTSRSEMDIDEQFSELSQRPDIDQAVGDYEQLLTTLRAALSEQFDLPDWNSKEPAVRSSTACPDFTELGAWDVTKRRGDTWIAEDSIPATEWSQALHALREIAGPHGFSTVTLDVDQEGHRVFEIMDAQGAKLSLGTMKHTTLRINTGCHLYPEAKQHGSPRPRPDVTYPTR